MPYLLHFSVYLLDNLVGIRACHLVNRNIDAWTAIGLANDVIVLRTQFHTGYVAYAQHVAIGQRTHHQILVVFLLLIASTVLQHILERVLTLGT